MSELRHGDFTELAEDYALYRPGYSPLVLDALLGLAAPVGGKRLRFADVGAGTGIWTRMVAAHGAESWAVEPNDEMRRHGEAQSREAGVRWLAGSAEATGLPSGNFDLVTMASSFHWPDFDQAVDEFRRVLRPGGVFCALWNTRFIEANPLLVDIEEYLKNLVPDMKRVSSGRSEFCAGLTQRLLDCGRFSDVLYLEGRHVELQSPERYLGLWRSVNDVRVQAGPERFQRFLDHIEQVTRGMRHIEATYLTRAWAARRA